MDLSVLARDTAKAAAMLPARCVYGQNTFTACKINADTLGNQYVPGGQLETFVGLILVPSSVRVTIVQGQLITVDGIQRRCGPVKPRPGGDGSMVELHTPEEQ